MKLYEEVLYEEPEEKKELQIWLRNLRISQRGISKVMDQDVTMEDLKTMTRDDLKGLGLPLGQEIRIWKCIQETRNSSI